MRVGPRALVLLVGGVEFVAVEEPPRGLLDLTPPLLEAVVVVVVEEEEEEEEDAVF